MEKGPKSHGNLQDKELEALERVLASRRATYVDLERSLERKADETMNQSGDTSGSNEVKPDKQPVN